MQGLAYGAVSEAAFAGVNVPAGRRPLHFIDGELDGLKLIGCCLRSFHPRRRARSAGGFLTRRRPSRECGDLVEGAFTPCISRSTRSARNS